MLLGGYAAIVQRNIKRLMAYSSIANVGYILLGLAAGTERGVEAVLVYLSIYLFMTGGAFAVILTMRRDGHMVEQLSDLAGLSRTRPMLALAMTIFMFSLGGIPPLAALGAVISVVSMFYYLWIIKIIYMDPPARPLDRAGPGLSGASLNGAVLVTALFTLLFAFAPIIGPVVGWADAAAHSLVQDHPT
jgi:NADH-quinone oxidoreductase subunit N